jgi:hypothetical protein
MPAVPVIPQGDWQCLVCKTRDEVFSIPETVDESCPPGSLQYKNKKEFMVACKFLSEIHSITESSCVRTHFETFYRLKYHRLPSSLNIIRNRLSFMTPNPYSSFKEMVDDLRLMFIQANELFEPNSDGYKFSKIFETKFLALHEEYVPLLQNAFPDYTSVVAKEEPSA